jgi:CRISPR/Cas system endoribonuclease Cas6 (RAMP superfamily)
MITGRKVNFNPRMRDLVSTLLRRLGNLSYLYSGKELPLGCNAVLARAESVSSNNNFRTARAIRYSARQSKTIVIGGIIGQMKFEDCPEDILTLLDIGEHIGIGRGTTMGLGDYSVE